MQFLRSSVYTFHMLDKNISYRVLAWMSSSLCSEVSAQRSSFKPFIPWIPYFSDVESSVGKDGQFYPGL
jgi:hypothetical protein